MSEAKKPRRRSRVPSGRVERLARIGGGSDGVRFFVDPVHLSPIGHEKLAEVLAPELAGLRP